MLIALLQFKRLNDQNIIQILTAIETGTNEKCTTTCVIHSDCCHQVNYTSLHWSNKIMISKMMQKNKINTHNKIQYNTKRCSWHNSIRLNLNYMRNITYYAVYNNISLLCYLLFVSFSAYHHHQTGRFPRINHNHNITK